MENKDYLIEEGLFIKKHHPSVNMAIGREQTALSHILSTGSSENLIYFVHVHLQKS